MCRRARGLSATVRDLDLEVSGRVLIVAAMPAWANKMMKAKEITRIVLDPVTVTSLVLSSEFTSI
jgi:hypothetical protein